ncbi:hypothetical protein P154DRAFT_432054 [Amniculicola lignicola CBS 123094]|uniref:Cep57 centrosome microtubule-binding domain-containing protein n=1 Tax=Amniculicola lignicola CBS 123094 TaxID=1392246 RepID=A0A6A5WLN0_9PLEO|nr:hypothetical protein P154DRAFT_432054 [Amniculicola lignicola CBS 123094]
MQSSPPMSEGKARAIRELSRSLSHSPLPLPSPSPPHSDSNPTQQLDQLGSDTADFFGDDDPLMSTQHRFEEETNTLPLPRIRSTAKKMNSWQPLRSEGPAPDTSMVNKQFNDFDQSSADSSDAESIEQARGGHRSNRSTPGKLSGFDELYDMTPPSARTRKAYPAQPGSLRRDAQIRRASRNDLDTASPRPGSTRKPSAMPSKTAFQRRSASASLAQAHAKVSEDDSSLNLDSRPPTLTTQAKPTRWGGSRSRQTSQQLDHVVEGASRLQTTPRSRPMTANTATAQSFTMPGIPNLTELFSGNFQDGTPLFSKTTAPRSRFSRRQPSYMGIEAAPLPREEKEIIIALQLLKDKVETLEKERDEAEKTIEEKDLEIVELKSAAQAREQYRRSDSGLGSTDGEGGSSKTAWKVEKTRLEASVQTLRTKIDRSERDLLQKKVETKRLVDERDSLAKQVGVAFQNFEELKRERNALEDENHTLRDEVDSLRAENDALQDQLEEEQRHHREETVQLRRRIDQAENTAQKENNTLHAELTRALAQNDQQTQHLTRKEAELRKARKEQIEYARIKTDNEALKAQIANIKAKRDEEARRFAAQEASLKGKVERRDETIRKFQDITQDHTNEAVRVDNENLRLEIEQLNAQFDEENRRWLQKEQKLQNAIQKEQQRQNTIQIDQEVLQQEVDQLNAKPPRRVSLRREETRTRTATRAQQEVRNSEAASASHQSFIERSPRKSYARSPHRASLPAESSRSVSAPIIDDNSAQYESDVESTTDLSLAPRVTPRAVRSASAVPTVSRVEPPEPLDITLLSFINADDLARVRRQVEEEHLARRHSSAPPERHPREDTMQSVASVKSSRPSLPRKSSMKDVTEKTTHTVFEDITGQVSNYEPTTAQAMQTKQSEAELADASMLSNTSRRRRSAPPVEMTSAFIVPDITIQTGRQDTLTLDLAARIDSRNHDNQNCTVCRRTSPNPPTDPLRVPKLVPVSSRTNDDVDATLRPSQSPKEALARVVKELMDERAHMHAELSAARIMFADYDVSKGARKRKQIEVKILTLTRRVGAKDMQIYNLYDVLEGQGDYLTEDDVENLTREIRVEDVETEQEKEKEQEKGKGRQQKKVTIQSYVDDSDSGVEHGRGGDMSGGELEEDAVTWNGFGDESDFEG